MARTQLPQPIKSDSPEAGTERSLSSPKVSLSPLNQPAADKKLDAFMEVAGDRCPASFLGLVRSDEDLRRHLSAVLDLSNYLNDLALKYPEVVEACWTTGFQAALDGILVSVMSSDFWMVDEASLMARLRHVKRKAALVLGIADLSGYWLADKVGRAMSRVADLLVQAAVRHLLHGLHCSGQLSLSDPRQPEHGCGFAVLAMGKHGAGELNYSSDIDLIVFYDSETVAIVDADSIGKHFIRLTKALVKLLQERTRDGYVFRTDLRLRPDPASTPVAVSVDAALQYYESRGQNWERAALIKARHIAGDPDVGNGMLQSLEPFIWRRYLDYAAIVDVHSIKRQIQAHRGLGDMVAPGHNVKLGRGGIREIEFFVQTQQLIAGGRNLSLRGRETLSMLAQLRAAEWITQDVQSELSQSYLFLRDVEHRLQMIDDAQTHTVPTDKHEAKRLALLCGFSTFEQFSGQLLAHLARVETHYAALFEREADLAAVEGNLVFSGETDDPETLAVLKDWGFSNPSIAISTVRGWHFGRYRATQSAVARERLTELVPALLKAFSDAGSPDQTLYAFDTFLQGLPAGIQLFSLFGSNPELLKLLATILGAAPRMAEIITKRPHVFDALLEPGFFHSQPSTDDLKLALGRILGDRDAAEEDVLNRIRAFAAEQRFLIGVRILGGALPAADAGFVYTHLAEIILSEVTCWVHDRFAEKHGHVPNASFALLALGNLGTKELTASSDIDLILLYEFEPASDMSNGDRPLHALEYFGRLTKRLIAAFSAPTPEGIVYELDFRLRPYGKDGAIATSLRAFERYHRESGWTWERMTLTRGRVILGSKDFEDKINQTIEIILEPTRHQRQLAKDVLEMRALMDKERPPSGDWDLKLGEGGLVDLEFLAQWAFLSGQTTRDGRTVDLLSRWVEGANGHDYSDLPQAYKQLHAITQLNRLCLNEPLPLEQCPHGLGERVLNILELPDIGTAQAHLKTVRANVRRIFLRALQDAAAS